MSDLYKFGMIGHNTGYSKSPDIFKAIFEIKNIPGSFDNHTCDPEEFEKKLPMLAAGGYRGLSVTIPFKSRVLPLLDDIDPVANALQAVNSILIRSGQLCGFNTDCHGFSLPLHPYADKLKHGTAMIIGSGGSAKAAVYTLYTDFEIKRFFVIGRSRTRLGLFRTSIRKQIKGIEIETIPLDDFITTEAIPFDIVVNCTPAGGWNQVDKVPMPEGFNWRPGRIYYDLNYNVGNKAIEAAVQRDMIAIDGSTMLVGQAIRSFNIWTGEKVEFESVYEKVFDQSRTAKQDAPQDEESD